MSFSVPSAMLTLQIIGGRINSHAQEAERKEHFFPFKKNNNPPLSTNLGFPGPIVKSAEPEALPL